MQQELGRAVTDAELLGHLADSLVSGKESSEGSSHQVIVQQCPDCETAAVESEEGSVPLERSTAAMVACDAERVGLEPGIDQPTPAWLRKAVIARDGGRCRSCRSPRGLMVHHVQFRSRGGRTKPENLVTLCAQCHALVHEGMLRIEGSDASRLRFVGIPEPGRPTAPILEILGGARAPRASQVPDATESVPAEVDSAWWRAHEDRLVWNARVGRFALRPEPAPQR